MADALDLGNVTLAVGQKVEFVLTLPSNAPNSVFLVSGGGAGAVPATASGTPLAWPYEVLLINGVGPYFVLGVSPGVVTYHFRTSSDPSNTTNLATASLTVVAAPSQGQSSGEEVVIEILSIAEPIVITIISQPPTSIVSD